MHTLSVRENPIVCLYVKAIHYTFDISSIFRVARQMAPCLLILEDIDTLLTEQLRSYFFNEVDGLENNDGIMMIATTNHLDKLDGGLAKRPSRFDRKYKFPIPDRDERILYCDYWRGKLQYNRDIEFPEKLSAAIADITQDFTFAYLKEAFVAALLVIAGQDEESGDEDEVDERIPYLEDLKPGLRSKHISDNKDISNLPLWIEIQKQVKMLREDMESGDKAAKKDTWSILPASTQRLLAPRTDNGVFRPALERDHLSGFLPLTRFLPPLQFDTEVRDQTLLAEPSSQDTLFRMRAEFNTRTGQKDAGARGW